MSSSNDNQQDASKAASLTLIQFLNLFDSDNNTTVDERVERERAIQARRAAYLEGKATAVRATIWGTLTAITVAAVVAMIFFNESVVGWLPKFAVGMPKDPALAALRIMDSAPVIDGHIDLPILVRWVHGNNVSAIDLESPMPAHVDIPRLRIGKVGGFFWSVFVGCAKPEEEGEDFITASWRVRDTLEQIDVAKLLIEKYPDTFQYALSPRDIETSIKQGKIASLLGVEGGHQLGNSLAVLRQYHALGVRYVTLTHICHNAFADSGGYLEPFEPLHHGLSPLGYALVTEMNRLGVLVDLSHTSDDTARQAIKHSRAPVMWSHSSARSVHNVARNVPDDILEMIGTEQGKQDGVIMINFAPAFVAVEGNATVAAVADHVEHIAKVAGKLHVGLGSDYDGIDETPEGLEDVSTYPALIAELYSRGWNKIELAGLLGGNFLRVFGGAERVSWEMQKEGVQPAYDLYDKRPDLPIRRKVEDL